MNVTRSIAPYLDESFIEESFRRAVHLARDGPVLTLVVRQRRATESPESFQKKRKSLSVERSPHVRLWADERGWLDGNIRSVGVRTPGAYRVLTDLGQSLFLECSLVAPSANSSAFAYRHDKQFPKVSETPVKMYGAARRRRPPGMKEECCLNAVNAITITLQHFGEQH
jgi:hypothetical protein